MFLSSHELDEVQRLADRVAIIRSGPAGHHRHGRAPAPERAAAGRGALSRGRSIRALFAGLDGVSVTARDGDRIALQVTGAIGPVLKVIAEHDPVDLIFRHADLDELFLDLYREPRRRRQPDAD